MWCCGDPVDRVWSRHGRRHEASSRAPSLPVPVVVTALPKHLTLGHVLPAAWSTPGLGPVALPVLFLGQMLLALTGSVDAKVDAVAQSIAWFASGFGVAGVWLLGWRGFLAVFLAILTQRMLHGYEVTLGVAEALGSGLEAAAGAFLLRRVGLCGDFSRLRDVGCLLLAATVVPFVSMLVSVLARSLDHEAALHLGLLSGWGGWWRMNALGVVVVVPLVLTVHARCRAGWRPRALLDGLAVVLIAEAWLGFVLFALAPSPTGITLLHAVFAFALIAALRHGPLGASTVAVCSATFVAVATTRGFGPFQCVAYAERHAAAQVFLLTLVIVPLVFGALVASRRELEAQLRQSHKLEAIGLLAGGLAHDFNNLLTVVSGNAEALREAAADGSEARVQATEILDAAARGAGLTRQLLAFSRRQVLDPRCSNSGPWSRRCRGCCVACSAPTSRWRSGTPRRPGCESIGCSSSRCC